MQELKVVRASLSHVIHIIYSFPTPRPRFLLLRRARLVRNNPEILRDASTDYSLYPLKNKQSKITHHSDEESHPEMLQEKTRMLY